MQRETLTAIQRADHAERWTPECSIMDDSDRAYRTGRQRQLLGAAETTPNATTEVTPGVTPGVTTEVDLRTPAYIRRGIGGEK